MTKRKTVVIIVAALLTAGAAIFLYGMGDPASGRLYPKCPCHLLTGLECPGCGSQRAVHCLLNGDLPQAFHYNALLVAAIPYLVLYAALILVSRVCRNADIVRASGRIYVVLYGGKALRTVLVLIILFWISRNFTSCF